MMTARLPPKICAVFESVRKKLKNWLNWKKKQKNWTVKKPVKSIKILKKSTGSVWFRFYKPETEKIESNRKTTEPNRFESIFILKNWTEPKPVGLNRFRFGYFFLYIKIKLNRKWSLIQHILWLILSSSLRCWSRIPILG